MAHKEVRQRIDDPDLVDPHRITHRNTRDIARVCDGEANDIHRHEVIEVIDDFDRGERILKVQPARKYFFQGG